MQPRVGGAANYYLPYVPYLVNMLGSHVKFICLKDSQTICRKRFEEVAPGLNFWNDMNPSLTYWDSCYPKYALASSDVQEHMANYWCDYYQTAKHYEQVWPQQFRIFHTKEDITSEVYKFIGGMRRIFRG